MAGVEPASKQAAIMLSTRLVFSWLSGNGREKTTQLLPYSFWFSNRHQGLTCLIVAFVMLWPERRHVKLPGEQKAA